MKHRPKKMRSLDELRRKLETSNGINTDEREFKLEIERQIRAIERRNDSSWPSLQVFDQGPSGSFEAFLGMISPAQLSRWAINALVEGYDSRSLRELAACEYEDACDSELMRLFEAVLCELVLPEKSAANIEKFSIVNENDLEINSIISAAPTESCGNYKGLLQISFYSRFQYVECVVSQVDFSADDSPGTLKTLEFLGDESLSRESFQVEIFPYDDEPFSASCLDDEEVKRIVLVCLREYLRGHRSQRSMGREQFEQLAAKFA